MKIIPVIDYMNDCVVLAEKGNRNEYRPVESSLCDGSDPRNIINALLAIADFDTLYIADLDSIVNQKPNIALWTEISSLLPNVEIWLDLGHQIKYWKHNMNHTANIRPVAGSESFQTLPELTSTLQEINNYRPLLSIDIKHGSPLGPADLLSNPGCWPDDIILLFLDRVGSATGLDEELLQSFLLHKSNHRIFVGGGVRDISDITNLDKFGFSGVLIANSLHSGSISSSDLNTLIS